MAVDLNNCSLHLRAITLGVNWEGVDKAALENRVRSFLTIAREMTLAKGYQVRTNRLVLSPVNKMANASKVSANNLIQWISSICQDNQIRWFCAPIDAVDSARPELDYEMAFEITSRYPNVFLNFMAAKRGVIDRRAILYGAKLVKAVSRLSNNGFDNFRVGISANGDANTPFFPFTHHEGNDGFSIALELPSLFLHIIQNTDSKDLYVIRENLLSVITPKIVDIEKLARQIEAETGLEYKGIDVSLAPLPDDGNSVARIVELLGIEGFGSNGTLFFTSYLKNILNQLIKRSGIKSVGFNGVMYSLLEDSFVGLNNNLKTFSIDSLVSFAAVCGCGVDMVPIPGDSFEEEIASVILDIAGLSTALEKPLGVRLLPIPMRYENEFTDFSHDFLHNTRIKSIRNRVCHSYIFEAGLFQYLEPIRALRKRPSE